nr:hypothetical protein [uncultured Lacibacter sp.]
MKLNLIIILSVLQLTVASTVTAQQQKTLRFELAAGVQSYYAPFLKSELSGLQTVALAGVHKPLNARNTIGLSFRAGYNRHNKQGDALFTQAVFQYNPVVAKHIEFGIGAGAGYQLSFYPSVPFKWNGTEWVEGKATKGVIQLPIVMSIGYRGIKTKAGLFTPYAAYQINALFRYSPDLTPLPSSYFLLGVKFSSEK